MSEVKKYKEIFDYLSAPELPTSEQGALVFGRQDPRLAKTMADMHRMGLVDYFVVSGGVGKDSGSLAEIGMPESQFVSALAQSLGVPDEKIHQESQATNGGENVRNSLVIIETFDGCALHGLTAVAHATSLRRLSATIEHEVAGSSMSIEKIDRVPTNYPFDPSKEDDQNEAVAELLRLADWPEKNWLQPQNDLPENLVDFARHQVPPKTS